MTQAELLKFFKREKGYHYPHEMDMTMLKGSLTGL